MDMVFAGNVSAVWRGIEHGLELLKKGLFGGWVMVLTFVLGETHGSLVDLPSNRSLPRGIVG